MDCRKLNNKQGYFFDGYTLLLGYIGGDGSAYFKYLSGKVIYSKPLWGFRTWQHGYKYDNWDWMPFEFIPHTAFNGLSGYLDFINNADYDELKKYFELKELMKTEDFQAFNLDI